jgi:hypothetical protein
MDVRTYSWFFNDPSKRGFFLHNANETFYHESFQGAAFILPLVPGAAGNDPMGYLHNHPTSSIAYAVNFGLRVVGHEGVHSAYSSVLEG